MEMGLSRKKPVEELFSNAASPHDIHRRPTRFLKMLYQQKHWQLGLKETQRSWNERRRLDFQNPIFKKQTVKLLIWKHLLTFMKKEEWLQSQSWKARSKAWATDYPQALKLMEFSWLNFKIVWTSDSILLPFPPFLNGNISNWYAIIVPGE